MDELNNSINIGKLTNLKNNVSIYVKDRTGMLSNQLSWTIIAGGIDLEIDFDDKKDKIEKFKFNYEHILLNFYRK